MNTQTFQNQAMQIPLRLSDYVNSKQQKNFVPNFFHRGITALILFVLLVVSVIAANAA